MMDLIAVYIFGFVLFLILLWYVIRARDFILLSKIPGPTPLPIFGNALELSNTTVYLPRLMEYKKKYGSVFKIFVGFQPPVIVISDHDFIEFLLGTTKILTRASYYKYFREWLGTGLLTSEGVKWRKHRKIITPAFHFKILEQSVQVFERNGDILLEKLSHELGNCSFDIYPYVTLYSLDVICETALGTKINAQLDLKSKYVESVHLMLKIIMDRFFSPILQHDCFYVFTNVFRKEREALRILHENTLRVIKQKRNKMYRENVEHENEDFGIKKKQPFIDLLLQSEIDGRPLTENDLRDEVETFMFEGHDATAVAMGYTLYLLSKHQDVQNKVVDELRTIFSDDKTRVCTYSDLQDMKYMEAVIKEAMRLYSPVPFIGRGVTEDIEYNGIKIPRGTNLIVFMYGIHMDENFFPEPKKFDPDRFVDSNFRNRSRYPYAHIPFSAGPRNCIGQKLAMAEIKHVLSKILRKFILFPSVPPHQPELSSQTTLKSLNGLQIRIEERVF